MIARIICPCCHAEVEAEVYQGMNCPGIFIECPHCETETEVYEDQCLSHRIDDEDDFDWDDEEEEIDNALSDTEGEPPLATVPGSSGDE